MLIKNFTKNNELFQCSIVEVVKETETELFLLESDDLEMIIEDCIEIEQDYYDFLFCEESKQILRKIIHLEVKHKDIYNSAYKEEYEELKIELEEKYFMNGFSDIRMFKDNILSIDN